MSVLLSFPYVLQFESANNTTIMPNIPTLDFYINSQTKIILLKYILRIVMHCF